VPGREISHLAGPIVRAHGVEWLLFPIEDSWEKNVSFDLSKLLEVLEKTL
jgi:hypothetical protein